MIDNYGSESSKGTGRDEIGECLVGFSHPVGSRAVGDSIER